MPKVLKPSIYNNYGKICFAKLIHSIRMSHKYRKHVNNTIINMQLINEINFFPMRQKNFVCFVYYYKISREKVEPEPGFEPRTSGFLAWRSTT